MTKEELINQFKEELINQFKEEFHTEYSLAFDYLEEMYLIGRLDGYNACLKDYWAEITSSATYTEWA